MFTRQHSMIRSDWLVCPELIVDWLDLSVVIFLFCVGGLFTEFGELFCLSNHASITRLVWTSSPCRVGSWYV